MRTAQSTANTPTQLPEWRMLMAGLCASLVGIGLARFAYTPLLPAIINAQWFSASTAAYLGAANLAGYLAGALLGVGIARQTGTRAALRLMMVLATLAFFACALPVSFIWFFLWRFVSGVSGGGLMVLAATSILPFVLPSRRGLASGVIFTGVGLGVAASGTLVPMLLQLGLTQTWLGLGLLSLLLTLLAWSSWPPAAPATATSTTSTPAAPISTTSTAACTSTSTSVLAPVTVPAEAAPNLNHRAGDPGDPMGMQATPSPISAGAGSRGLYVLYLVYGLNAVGLVAHMVFLVDYVARGLGWGVNTGSFFWVIYGLGAVAGPLCTGAVADRIGYGLTLRAALLLQLLMVSLPILSTAPILLGISSFAVGAFTPGIVPLVLGRLREMLPHSPTEQKTAWSRATTAFALMQAAAAYAMSFVFAHSNGQYWLLFMLAAAALAIAFVMLMLSPGPTTQR
ncbi:YbfB/YjiJ family MFS transporter [Advenella sp. FME57]|uniref:YbfB/YjiJ family MFS transporter n=1 Tax=Advenella sp. FME57 TaxID=2742604 RepID=UPI001865DC80|nr:YbfB/YjiJ family MFS transporter [Advenella sp. FME57]